MNTIINQDKTYFMTIGKSKTNTEIFDYENYENDEKNYYSYF